MRPQPVDENGNPIPFTDFDHYGRLEHLVPGALCSTRAGKITEWKDSRPQPTYDEINAVSDADAELAMKQPSENVIAAENDVIQAILDNVPQLRGKVLAQLKTQRGK